MNLMVYDIATWLHKKEKVLAHNIRQNFNGIEHLLRIFTKEGMAIDPFLAVVLQQ